MVQSYMIRAKRLVTVGKLGTIVDGAMVVENGKIVAIGSWAQLNDRHADHCIIDCSTKVITPSLVDCHTHLLEFAPSSLYPVTKETHFNGGNALLLHALSSGITAIGEQICGHPHCDFSIDDYRRCAKDAPLDVSFAATSISIGFEHLTHYTSITQSKSVEKATLIDQDIIKKMAQASDYPGENLFINATPANFLAHDVPRAGELVYSLDELKQIVHTFHRHKKKIGVHVAGEVGITMALDAGVDVMHHAHGITEDLIERTATQGVKIVATPLGGTHVTPNSPEEIVKLITKNIQVSIATDAYLPPYPGADWLNFQDGQLKGPDVLMTIASPAMKLLKENHFNDNDILELITKNPAQILGKENQFGSLDIGMDANFIVADGIPGLEITKIEEINYVYYKGKMMIDRVIR